MRKIEKARKTLVKTLLILNLLVIYHSTPQEMVQKLLAIMKNTNMMRSNKKWVVLPQKAIIFHQIMHKMQLND